MLEKPSFLVEKYPDLSESSGVVAAAKRKERRTGEGGSDTQAARIQGYLDRLRELTMEGDVDKRQRGIEVLKRFLYKTAVIRPKNIPESYWETQKRIARKRGQGVSEITERARKEGTEVIIADQKSTLDAWIDYLTSQDAPYPDWARYWVVREVLNLSRYDKTTKRFRNRHDEEGVTAPFPDIDREALATVINVIVKSQEQTPERQALYKKNEQLTRELRNKIRQLRGVIRAAGSDPKTVQELGQAEEVLKDIHLKQDHLLGLDTLFAPKPEELEERGKASKPNERILQKARLKNRLITHQRIEEGDFARLYAWAIEEVTPASKESLENVEGLWVVYPKGSDPMTFIPSGFSKALVPSLQGHGTGWCTAAESTARTQLQEGDFHVYYSHNKKGEPVPRVAIRMEGEAIAEVRGIAADQNLDPYIGETVQKKMSGFPGGKMYEKKAQDMKLLTALEKKVKEGTSLTREDLTFLYEINGPILGFGYRSQRDPRIDELRQARNPIEDAPIVLNCRPEEIAGREEDVTQATKAYIGRIFPGIFQTFPNLTDIYTSFPEGRIRRHTIEVGHQPEDKLRALLKKDGFVLTKDARSMVENRAFRTVYTPEKIEVVTLRKKDFGSRSFSLEELYMVARRYGLDLCPPEAGPCLRLTYKDQPLHEYLRVAMKPIGYHSDSQSVFVIKHDDQGMGLDAANEIPPDVAVKEEARYVFLLCQQDRALS